MDLNITNEPARNDFRIASRHVGDELLDDPDRLKKLYKAHVTATSWWVGSQISAAAASAACVAARSLGWASVLQGVGTLIPVGMTRYHHGRATREVEPEPSRPIENVPAENVPGELGEQLS